VRIYFIRPIYGESEERRFRQRGRRDADLLRQGGRLLRGGDAENAQPSATLAPEAKGELG